jgi:hypothetical protein
VDGLWPMEGGARRVRIMAHDLSLSLALHQLQACSVFHNRLLAIRLLMAHVTFNVVYTFMLYRFRSILIFQKTFSFRYHITSMGQRVVFDVIGSFTQQKRTKNPRRRSFSQQFSEAIAFAYVVFQIESCRNIQHLNSLYNIKL